MKTCIVCGEPQDYVVCLSCREPLDMPPPTKQRRAKPGRNQRIIEARRAGRKFSEIGRAEGISPERVRQIWAEWKKDRP